MERGLLLVQEGHRDGVAMYGVGAPPMVRGTTWPCQPYRIIGPSCIRDEACASPVLCSSSLRHAFLGFQNHNMRMGEISCQ